MLAFFLQLLWIVFQITLSPTDALMGKGTTLVLPLHMSLRHVVSKIHNKSRLCYFSSWSIPLRRHQEVYGPPFSNPKWKNRSHQNFGMLRCYQSWKGEEEMMKNENFLQKIKKSLQDDILPVLDSTNTVVVLLLAVSGGCDSIGLFHSIRTIVNHTKNDQHNNNIHSSDPTKNHKFEIHVAHFDHHQRGIESDKDRMFVHDLCHQANIPFHCFHWENKNEEYHFSQERARIWRRNKLEQLLESLTNNEEETTTRKKGIILTAHHKDDSDETVLLKLLRGVHITNLHGIDPVSYGERNQIFGRPMLTLYKEEVEHFLTSQGLEWREDLSNKSDKYLRNRVRNELIPLMADMVGGKDILQVTNYFMMHH